MTKSEILQVAKSITFNTEMVRAILDGRKTATRRVVKPQPVNAHMILGPSEEEDRTFEFMCGGYNGIAFMDWIETVKMPYQPGDCLYVREAWAPINTDKKSDTGGYMYRVDDIIYFSALGKRYSTGRTYQWPGIWRPSIHMPKEAARIFLRVMDVRPERLQEITMNGMLAEGVIPENVTGGQWEQWQNDYMKPAWDSAIKPKDREKYGWAMNPWVWVIEFEHIKVKAG